MTRELQVSAGSYDMTPTYAGMVKPQPTLNEYEGYTGQLSGYHYSTTYKGKYMITTTPDDQGDTYDVYYHEGSGRRK